MILKQSQTEIYGKVNRKDGLRVAELQTPKRKRKKLQKKIRDTQLRGGWLRMESTCYTSMRPWVQDPRPTEKPGVEACLNPQCRGGRDRESPGVCWPSVYNAQLQASESLGEPVSKTKEEGDIQHRPWPLHVCMSIRTWTQMCTHRDTLPIHLPNTSQNVIAENFSKSIKYIHYYWY